MSYHFRSIFKGGTSSNLRIGGFLLDGAKGLLLVLPDPVTSTSIWPALWVDWGLFFDVDKIVDRFYDT